MSHDNIPLEFYNYTIETEDERVSEIEKDFMKYQALKESVHHSPNTSPSNPINNGDVSE